MTKQKREREWAPPPPRPKDERRRMMDNETLARMTPDERKSLLQRVIAAKGLMCELHDMLDLGREDKPRNEYPAGGDGL